MTNHNLRYYALGSLTGLTVVGWILNKVPEEVTIAIFAALGLVITADWLKHKDEKK